MGLLFEKNDVKYHNLFGEMVEWFKAAVLKTAVGSPHRGFESLSLRHSYLSYSIRRSYDDSQQDT